MPEGGLIRSDFEIILSGVTMLIFGEKGEVMLDIIGEHYYI
jgi:hypothetical protein